MRPLLVALVLLLALPFVFGATSGGGCVGSCDGSCNPVVEGQFCYVFGCGIFSSTEIRCDVHGRDLWQSSTFADVSYSVDGFGASGADTWSVTANPSGTGCTPQSAQAGAGNPPSVNMVTRSQACPGTVLTTVHPVNPLGDTFDYCFDIAGPDGDIGCISFTYPAASIQCDNVHLGWDCSLLTPPPDPGKFCSEGPLAADATSDPTDGYCCAAGEVWDSSISSCRKPKCGEDYYAGNGEGMACANEFTPQLYPGTYGPYYCSDGINVDDGDPDSGTCCPATTAWNPALGICEVQNECTEPGLCSVAVVTALGSSTAANFAYVSDASCINAIGACCNVGPKYGFSPYYDYYDASGSAPPPNIQVY